MNLNIKKIFNLLILIIFINFFKINNISSDNNLNKKKYKKYGKEKRSNLLKKNKYKNNKKNNKKFSKKAFKKVKIDYINENIENKEKLEFKNYYNDLVNKKNDNFLLSNDSMVRYKLKTNDIILNKNDLTTVLDILSSNNNENLKNINLRIRNELDIGQPCLFESLITILFLKNIISGSDLNTSMDDAFKVIKSSFIYNTYKGFNQQIDVLAELKLNNLNFQQKIENEISNIFNKSFVLDRLNKNDFYNFENKIKEINEPTMALFSNRKKGNLNNNNNDNYKKISNLGDGTGHYVILIPDKNKNIKVIDITASKIYKLEDFLKNYKPLNYDINNYKYLLILIFPGLFSKTNLIKDILSINRVLLD